MNLEDASNNTPAFDERKKKVISLIAEYLAVQEVPPRSAARLARQIAVSPTAISQLRKSCYQGDVVRLVEKLEKFFALEDERLAIAIDADFVETKNATQILVFAHQTHILRSIGVIIGSAGIGKTKALKDYASRTPSAIYIQAHPFLRGKNGFLRRLCLEYDVRTTDAIKAFETLKEVAHLRGSLMIIDDMQVMSTEQYPNTTIFEVIRALADAGIGFILSGNRELRDHVTRTENESWYQQLASRADLLEVADTFTRDDAALVAFSLLQRKLADDVLDAVFEIANRFYGSYRVMVRMLTVAALRAGAQGSRTITLRHVQDAAKLKLSQVKPQFKNLEKKRGAINVNVEKEIAGSDVGAPRGGAAN